MCESETELEKERKNMADDFGPNNAMMADAKYATHSFGDWHNYTILAIAHANNHLQGGDEFRSKSILRGCNTLTEAMSVIHETALIVLDEFYNNPTLNDWTPTIIGTVVFKKGSKGAVSSILGVWMDLTRYSITQEKPEGAIELPEAETILWITHLDPSFNYAEMDIARNKSATLIEIERPITSPYWDMKRFIPPDIVIDDTTHRIGKKAVGISPAIAKLGLSKQRLRELIDRGNSQIKYGNESLSIHYFHGEKIKGKKHTIVVIFAITDKKVDSILLCSEEEAKQIKKHLNG